MRDKAELFIIYDGPALVSHEMDVRELVPALLSVADVLEHTNRILNGDRTQIDVKVKASFQSGSFGIEFVVIQSCFQQILDLFNSQYVTGTINLLTALGFISLGSKGLLSFLKWLRNRPIKNIKQMDYNQVRIFVEDEYVDIEQDVLALYRDLKLRQSLEQMITKPLEKEGIETFSISQNKKDFVPVEKEERYWFASSPVGEFAFQDIENKVEIEKLQAVSLAFRDNNKWRFTDGSVTFYAVMLDEEFAQRIQKNEEKFSKDDIFEVEIRKRRWIDENGKMNSEYQILKVLDHKSASKQLELPFTD